MNKQSEQSPGGGFTGQCGPPPRRRGAANISTRDVPATTAATNTQITHIKLHLTLLLNLHTSKSTHESPFLPRQVGKNDQFTNSRRSFCSRSLRRLSAALLYIAVGNDGGSCVITRKVISPVRWLDVSLRWPRSPHDAPQRTIVVLNLNEDGHLPQWYRMCSLQAHIFSACFSAGY